MSVYSFRWQNKYQSTYTYIFGRKKLDFNLSWAYLNSFPTWFHFLLSFNNGILLIFKIEVFLPSYAV